MLTSDDILVKINGKYKSMFQNAIDHDEILLDYVIQMKIETHGVSLKIYPG